VGVSVSGASRRKGASAEREVVAILREFGFNARRTPQSGAWEIPGDVMGVDGYAIEVKRCERWNVPAWLRQAHVAARGGDVPVLVFRRSASGADPCGRWHACLPLAEWASLVKSAAGEL
jgi:Holliday junction resolvase